MAKIKGWKRTQKNNPDTDYWRSVKGRVILLGKTKDGYYTNLKGRFGDVHHKTKEKATKKLMAYMRSHPNG